MLDKYFEYKKHKTDFKTEVIAGTTTFLTMAYIMFLNPFILSGEFAGPEKGFFDFGAVYTATILATALACFIMAFYGKTWPIGLAPGMGINAFVAFGVCAGMGYTPQEALGAVLVAGVLFLIISLLAGCSNLLNQKDPDVIVTTEPMLTKSEEGEVDKVTSAESVNLDKIEGKGLTLGDNVVYFEYDKYSIEKTK